MSSMVLSGDTSGAITLAAPAVSGTNTATLPAATGTVMVSGNMPAFSAYNSSATSISNSTDTKIQFQTKEFDTNSAYDNATNYRFTPQVAGYYQVTGMVSITGNSVNPYSKIYKNGAEFKRGTQLGSATNGVGCLVSALVYFNGSTDYVEIYAQQNSGLSQTTNAGQVLTYFQAVMVRSA